MAEHKFNCEQCNFHTNYKSQWDKHIETEKHRTGKRKTRSDKIGPIECDKCDHVASNRANMRLHILNNHSTKEERKTGFKYYCEYCDYGNFAQTSYNTHLNTKKHKLIVELMKNMGK